MKIKRSPLFSLCMIGILAVSRWPGMLPHNFSLVYAFVFCAGAFPRVLPGWSLLATLFATDIVVNVGYYQTAPFSDYMLANYAAYGLMYILGRRLTRTTSIPRFMGGGLLAAVIFYLVTNTAAWLQNPEYSRTFAGWFQSLTVGTSGWPETWKFFRNTLLSGGLFSGFLATVLRAAAPSPSEDEQTAEAEEPEATEAATEESEA